MAGMRAMVLAAGIGERMRPLTDHVPKPLLPIANRPAMGYVLEHLGRHGFTEVIANLHYRPEEIVDHFGSGGEYGVSLTYSYEEELLGPAGGVRHCKDFLGGETFLVTGADDLTSMDLTALLAAHRDVGAMASIALVEVEETSEYGIVVTDNAGRIDRFVEKPKGEAPSRTANTQIYLFEPDVFEFIPPDRFYDFGFHAFPAMVEAGVPFYGFSLDGYWRDIGTIQDYLAAQRDVLEGRLPASIGGRQLTPGVWMGDGCDIDDSAELLASVLLGDGCRVGAKARLGGGTCVGADADVGEEAEVWESVVWPGVPVPPRAKLQGAVATAGGIFRG
jgi:mannose-1-phosphate guanylyltransferase/phosphomannomutase